MSSLENTVLWNFDLEPWERRLYLGGIGRSPMLHTDPLNPEPSVAPPVFSEPSPLGGELPPLFPLLEEKSPISTSHTVTRISIESPKNLLKSSSSCMEQKDISSENKTAIKVYQMKEHK